MQYSWCFQRAKKEEEAEEVRRRNRREEEEEEKELKEAVLAGRPRWNPQEVLEHQILLYFFTVVFF